MATHRCGIELNDGRGWLCLLFDEEKKQEKIVKLDLILSLSHAKPMVSIGSSFDTEFDSRLQGDVTLSSLSFTSMHLNNATASTGANYDVVGTSNTIAPFLPFGALVQLPSLGSFPVPTTTQRP